MRATLTLENGMTVPDQSLSNPDPAWPEARLTLKSQLEDLTLVWPWVEAIAARYSVPADTQFAIQLCQSQPNQAISVEYAPACVENDNAEELVFTVEDHAPPFDPLAPSADAPAPAPVSIQEFPPGGQGIRLMRKFAGRLAWQQLPNGNRLTLAFTIPRSLSPSVP